MGFLQEPTEIEREVMETQLLQTMFERLGARVKIRQVSNSRLPLGIDIRADSRGEYFDIGVELNDPVQYQVVDIRPEMRQLLVMERRENGKQKFLCGHDERHWFVCAVPGESVSSVTAAMEALQPPEVRETVKRTVKRVKNRLRRKTKAFVRQGEWFFTPAAELTVNPKLILRNGPVSRGRGGKSHMCQYMYRAGGELVYVCARHPQGLTANQYSSLLKSDSRARGWKWTTRQRNASVFVRGRIWHPDHKTVVLDAWHRVSMNTEWQAPGARAVVFLD